MSISIIGAITLIFVLLHARYASVLDPHGTIALQQRRLIIFATVLMLVIVIPVFILTYYFAWRYRAGNPKAHYVPNWNHNPKLELVWWALPTIIVAILSVVIWRSSRQLDPYKSIPSANPPITIQVVALDWKWLFIYPQQGIATVNYVEFPANTPVNFQITADAPMNSFWIPDLGGQIYAMPGMETQLNLMAETQGDYNGSSANISGAGFSGMKFIAHAASQTDFDQWVLENQKDPIHLTAEEYEQLSQPSTNNLPAYYTLAENNLFNSIISKYMSPVSEPTSMPGMDMSNGSMKGMN